MSRVSKLAEELKRSVFGDPWHGTSAKEILNGINAEEAYRKPIASAHNIIELTLHLTAWTEELLSRFNGNSPAIPRMGDWPPSESRTKEYWEVVKQNLFDETNKLIAVVRIFPEEKLDTIPNAVRNAELGTGFSFEELISGLVQHNAYHLGQISLIKKSF